MGLKKGGVSVEEQMQNMTQRSEGGDGKLRALKFNRMMARIIFFMSMFGACMSGLLALLANKVSGNPFIYVTLFFIVVAFFTYKAAKKFNAKIRNYL